MLGRLLVWLSHPVPAFEPSRAQLTALSERVPATELVVVHSEPDFLQALPQARAVLVWRFLAEWYALAPCLQHAFTPSAGHEPLPADPSARVARHFGRFHGALMSESLLAMLTFMNRRLGEALRDQGRRRWDRSPYSRIRRLKGQVVLLVGYGAIAQACARTLSGLGMVVHALRRDVTRPSPYAERVFAADQLHAALPLADHVACLLPADTGTDHLLDAPALRQMKPSACVYNLGRGNAIDLEALGEALSRGQLAGAFLDVVSHEPLPADSLLWTTPNLYLTPHASAISSEYLDLYFEELAAELAGL
ncbi:MAG TPA: NAD(P)-dependent oxidoreductase [Polyangiaceae bacterium]|nr:NAD(P)-dependent oxidoreductase [Polyangiaceae bacterium]